MFITTNFDRLLEQALAARGVQPVVVSDDATLGAAPSREHAPVFIVKAHGDYMQETIRNTTEELSELPADLTDELRLIVDRHGLLVLGWRGSDQALSEIIRGRSPSRYGVWWLSRSETLAEPGRTLAEAVSARVIVRPSGAGSFLAELASRVGTFTLHESGDDPCSVHDQVLNLVKRGEDVELDGLLRREQDALASAFEQVRANYANRQPEDKVIAAAWGTLGTATDRRLASLIPLAIYRPELLKAEIERDAARASNTQLRDGFEFWLKPWRLPFWVIGMALGALSLSLRPVRGSWSDHFGHVERAVRLRGRFRGAARRDGGVGRKEVRAAEPEWMDLPLLELASPGPWAEGMASGPLPGLAPPRGRARPLYGCVRRGHESGERTQR